MKYFGGTLIAITFAVLCLHNGVTAFYVRQVPREVTPYFLPGRNLFRLDRVRSVVPSTSYGGQYKRVAVLNSPQFQRAQSRSEISDEQPEPVRTVLLTRTAAASPACQPGQDCHGYYDWWTSGGPAGTDAQILENPTKIMESVQGIEPVQVVSQPTVHNPEFVHHAHRPVGEFTKENVAVPALHHHDAELPSPVLQTDSAFTAPVLQKQPESSPAVLHKDPELASPVLQTGSAFTAPVLQKQPESAPAVLYKDPELASPVLHKEVEPSPILHKEPETQELLVHEDKPKPLILHSPSEPALLTTEEKEHLEDDHLSTPLPPPTTEKVIVDDGSTPPPTTTSVPVKVATPAHATLVVPPEEEKHFEEEASTTTTTTTTTELPKRREEPLSVEPLSITELPIVPISEPTTLVPLVSDEKLVHSSTTPKPLLTHVKDKDEDDEVEDEPLPVTSTTILSLLPPSTTPLPPLHVVSNDEKLADESLHVRREVENSVEERSGFDSIKHFFGLSDNQTETTTKHAEPVPAETTVSAPAAAAGARTDDIISDKENASRPHQVDVVIFAIVPVHPNASESAEKLEADHLLPVDDQSKLILKSPEEEKLTAHDEVPNYDVSSPTKKTVELEDHQD